jgi:hypothetical protein
MAYNQIRRGEHPSRNRTTHPEHAMTATTLRPTIARPVWTAPAIPTTPAMARPIADLAAAAEAYVTASAAAHAAITGR